MGTNKTSIQLENCPSLMDIKPLFLHIQTDEVLWREGSMLTITELVLLCGLHSFSVYWLFSERNEIKMEPRSMGGVLGKIRGKIQKKKKSFLDCGCVTCPIDWSWTPAGGNSPVPPRQVKQRELWIWGNSLRLTKVTVARASTSWALRAATRRGTWRTAATRTQRSTLLLLLALLLLSPPPSLPSHPHPTTPPNTA